MTHDRDGPTADLIEFKLNLAKACAEALCKADWFRWLSTIDVIDDDNNEGDDDLDFVEAQPVDNSTVVVGKMAGTVSGPPAAKALSEAEIAHEFANAQDPWARCDGVERISQNGRPHPSAIAAAAGLGMLFDDEGDLQKIFRPGGITNVICASAATRSVLEEILRVVTDHWQKRILSQKGPDLHFHNFSARPDASTRDRTRAQHEFQIKVENSLRRHGPVLIISSRARQLPAALESLTRRIFRWAGFTAEMIIEALRLTHSTTGMLAEAEIRKRLPSPTALKRLEPAQIDAAFEEATTLLVADRLAEIANAPMGPKAVTLDAVQGLGATRGYLDRMLNDLQEWQEGQLAWPDVTSSAVFHGPPGTGKTMLAKAIAGSAGIPLISTSYAECQKAGHQGDMLAALSAAFEEAAQAAPAVLFIDEIDSFSDRGGDASNRSYMRGVVNGLLEQINHAVEVEGLVLLGATNHLDAIDEAVIRSGRFDLKLHIPYPNRAGIEAILSARLGQKRAEQLNLRAVTDRLVGQSGATVEALVRDALGRARAEKTELQQKHLMEAADHLAPTLSPSLQRRIAIHEAGHVLATLLSPLPTPKRAQLTAQGGMVEQGPLPILTPDWARARLQVLLAGRAAEIHLCGVPTSGAGLGPQSDLAQATELALAAETRWGFGESGLAWHGASVFGIDTAPEKVKDQVERHLRTAHEKAMAMIEENTELLSRIADRLVEARELDGQELEAIRRSLPVQAASMDAHRQEAVYSVQRV
ncbi:AAA family ATPase [Roseovarius arcticus]|uniref:AAA family ATPase n=1 Tax=Roseovarius arcticus TaxID=2547404 RepID=UPI001110078C|nr:AAA family ATPase [Roseovarius arcticus]